MLSRIKPAVHSKDTVNQNYVREIRLRHKRNILKLRRREINLDCRAETPETKPVLQTNELN